MANSTADLASNKVRHGRDYAQTQEAARGGDEGAIGKLIMSNPGNDLMKHYIQQGYTPTVGADGQIGINSKNSGDGINRVVQQAPAGWGMPVRSDGKGNVEYFDPVAAYDAERRDLAPRYDEARKQLDDTLLQEGAKQAVLQGGRPAMVDYYLHNAPEIGMQLQKQDLELQKGILDVAGKQTNNDSDKLKYLQQAYGMMGGAGQMIAKLPADQQEAAYQKVLPQLQQINPNMPKTFKDGQQIMDLSLGMATPPAQLYSAQQQNFKAQSSLGKLNQDLMNAEKRGDPADAIAALRAERDKALTTAEQAKLNVTGKKLDIANTKTQAENVLRDDYRKDSDPFVMVNTGFRNATEAYRTLKEGKFKGSPGAFDTVLMTGTARMFEKGVLTEQDIARYRDTDPRGEDFIKHMFDKTATGAMLTNDERDHLYEINKFIYDAQYKNQLTRQSTYQKLAAGKELNPDAVNVIPVETSEAIYNNAGKKNDPFVGLPDDLRAMASAAVAKGADPAKVAERSSQLLKQRGGK